MQWAVMTFTCLIYFSTLLLCYVGEHRPWGLCGSAVSACGVPDRETRVSYLPGRPVSGRPWCRVHRERGVRSPHCCQGTHPVFLARKKYKPISVSFSTLPTYALWKRNFYQKNSVSIYFHWLHIQHQYVGPLNALVN